MMKAIIGIDVRREHHKNRRLPERSQRSPRSLCRRRTRSPPCMAHSANSPQKTGSRLFRDRQGHPNRRRLLLCGRSRFTGSPARTPARSDCVGRGGLYLSELEEAMVISMGTGHGARPCQTERTDEISRRDRRRRRDACRTFQKDARHRAHRAYRRACRRRLATRTSTSRSGTSRGNRSSLSLPVNMTASNSGKLFGHRHLRRHRARHSQHGIRDRRHARHFRRTGQGTARHRFDRQPCPTPSRRQKKSLKI